MKKRNLLAPLLSAAITAGSAVEVRSAAHPRASGDIASIDIVLEEKLPERAAAIEARVKAAVTTMAQRYDFIADVLGRGVLLGIELVEDRETRKPANEMCREAVRRCEAKGLLVQARGSHARTNVIRLVPPMVCTDNEIDHGLTILEEVFAGIARGRVGARDIAAQ